MGYESSTGKRQVHGHESNLIQKIHGLKAAVNEVRDSRAASNHRLAGKERLLTTQRPLSRKTLTLAKQTHRLSAAVTDFKDAKAVSIHSSTRKEKLLKAKRQLPGNAPALAQKTRSMISEINQLQGGQYETIKPSNVKADQNLTANADRNVEPSALYIIKASPGKGLGMFATKDIRKGTRILAEKPFFSLSDRPVISESDPYAPNDITEAYDRLPASEQRKYMGLHCPERSDCSRGVSIYEANCFEMGSGTCICLDASRINHSCLPNAHYSWNNSIKQETVHAMKDISRGEEITISYCSAIRTLEERQRELKPYLFTCSCSACRTDTDFGIRSQIRREQMLDLDHEIADYQNDASAAQMDHGHIDEQSAIVRLIHLIDEEGLVFEKSLAYHDAAKWALKRGLREKALEYASKEIDMDLCCVGRDSPSYGETITFFLKIYFGTEEVLI